MYVDVSDLPQAVREALSSVGYGRSNIELRAAPSVQLGTGAGGAGRRGFVTLINLTSGQHRTQYGSWGGSNMFVQTAVDDDNGSYPLPGDGCAITGSVGGSQPVYAVLHVPASMVDRMLPAPTEPLSQADKDTLYCHASVIGGAYRREELRRRNVTPADVDRAVERGWIKRNRAGACQITTAGRNALGDYRVSRPTSREVSTCAP